MIVTVFESDPKILQQKAGERVAALLGGTDPVLFLSSGGSSLALLDHIDPIALSPQCTIGMIDDRWSTDPAVNSFLQLERSTFGKAALAQGLSLINTAPAPGETLEGTATRFEHDLRNWKTAYPEGRVVVTQGMGPDGHTIGILPFPEAPDFFEKTFDREEQWVVGYDAAGKNPYPLRVTTTFTFLRRFTDHSIMYLGSLDKEETLRKALTSGSRAEIPARIIQDMKSVEIFAPFRVSV